MPSSRCCSGARPSPKWRVGASTRGSTSSYTPATPSAPAAAAPSSCPLVSFMEAPLRRGLDDGRGLDEAVEVAHDLVEGERRRDVLAHGVERPLSPPRI